MSWPGLPPMGGHAFYVWASYAITLTAMGGEVLLLLWRQRSGAMTSTPQHPAGG